MLGDIKFVKLVIPIVILKQHLGFSIHNGVKTGHCLINVIMCGNLKQKCYLKVYEWQGCVIVFLAKWGNLPPLKSVNFSIPT